MYLYFWLRPVPFSKTTAITRTECLCVWVYVSVCWCVFVCVCVNFIGEYVTQISLSGVLCDRDLVGILLGLQS